MSLPSFVIVGVITYIRQLDERLLAKGALQRASLNDSHLRERQCLRLAPVSFPKKLASAGSSYLAVTFRLAQARANKLPFNAAGLPLPVDLSLSHVLVRQRGHCDISLRCFLPL